jgi:hypothetical protein
MPKKIKKNKEEFSAEQGNLEIVSANEKDDRKPAAWRGSGSVFIGTLNLVVNPIKEQTKKRHEKFYKNSKFHLVADILLVLSVLVLLSIFIIFWNFQPKAEIILEAELTGGLAQSGQAASLEIEYENNSKAVIKDAKLSVVFPENFVLLSVWPENIFIDQSNTFSLGDLEHKVKGKIKIVGVPYGEINSRQMFAYSLNYSHNGRLENTLGSFGFVLESSALATDLTIPTEVFSKIDFGGKIIVKNSGRADLEKDIVISFSGSPFEIKSISSAAATLVNNEISLGRLKVGEQEEINFTAGAQAEGEYDFSADIYLSSDGKKFLQQKISKHLKISQPKFQTEIAIDKKVAEDGEAVDYKISFINNEESEARDISFYISPADSSLSLKSLILKNASEKYFLDNTTVKIGSLAAGEEGELELEAVLERKKINQEQEAGLAFNLNYRAGEKNIDYIFYSPKIKILSDLQVSSRGFYYSAEGDQLGIGPLPPAVDVPTRYWIFWEIDNLGNDLKDFAMTADLPANVGWTGQKSLLAGDIRYGAISKKIVWNVDDVSRADGSYRAGFEVELIPSAAQVGKIPDLLTNIKYSATDVFANAEISGELSDVTADLKDDPSASGKGTVIKINIVK